MEAGEAPQRVVEPLGGPIMAIPHVLGVPAAPLGASEAPLGGLVRPSAATELTQQPMGERSDIGGHQEGTGAQRGQRGLMP